MKTAFPTDSRAFKTRFSLELAAKAHGINNGHFFTTVNPCHERMGSRRIVPAPPDFTHRFDVAMEIDYFAPSHRHSQLTLATPTGRGFLL